MAINNQIEWTKGIKAFLLKLRMFPKFLRVKKYMDKSAAEVMDSFFNEEKLKAIFMGILADFVVKPSEFPGLGVPLTNVETAFDTRIPVDIPPAMREHFRSSQILSQIQGHDRGSRRD